MSDLIDRDALMKEFQTFVRRSNNHDYAPVPTWNDAVSLVGSMPSAESERKWIPVTERLPEDNRQVLVYAQSVHYALAKYDEMMDPDGEWKKQWVTFDAWKPYYTIKNVIAWMPLPEPWRGEE